MRSRIVLISLAAVLLLEDSAYAWGPVTHIALARSILERLDLLPAVVGTLLGRHALAYLYGNIAADMVVAKRLSRVKQFCHHWSTAFRLWESAEDGRSRAFAYGYLSHLAADTVAHGKFVPRQVVLTQCPVNVGHLLWELRADALCDGRDAECLDRLLERDHSSHDQTLACHFSNTFLSFGLNRLVFEGMSSLVARHRFRRTVNCWARNSRWELSSELVAGYREECVDRTISILTKGAASPLLKEDPNGTSAMMKLKVDRRDLRRRERWGLPTLRRVREASFTLTPSLAP